MKYILVLLLTISGCSFFNVKHKGFKAVNVELLPYVVEFSNIYRKLCKEEMDTTIDVRLERIEGYPQAQGVYYRISDYTVISADHWPKLNYWRKKEVIFHELGHHVLGLGHDWSEGEHVKGCPKSMMYYRGAGSCFGDSEAAYVKELFKRAGCE